MASLCAFFPRAGFVVATPSARPSLARTGITKGPVWGSTRMTTRALKDGFVCQSRLRYLALFLVQCPFALRACVLRRAPSRPGPASGSNNRVRPLSRRARSPRHSSPREPTVKRVLTDPSSSQRHRNAYPRDPFSVRFGDGVTATHTV